MSKKLDKVTCLRVQSCLHRYQAITEMYVAYTATGHPCDVFAPEFYHGVAMLLQGKPLSQVLEESHLIPDEVIPQILSSTGDHPTSVDLRNLALVRRKWKKPSIKSRRREEN